MSGLRSLNENGMS